jgi:hypothetical protein
MAFQKEKLADELKKQVEALDGPVGRLGFTRVVDGHYWDEFYHDKSGVRVKPVAFKEPNRYGSYGGFKLKIERGFWTRCGRNTILVGIDNIDAVKKAVEDSIKHKKDSDESERANKKFKETVEKTLPRLFPGRYAKVYEGRGEFSASISRKDHTGAWFDIKLQRDGTVAEVRISYPGKSLEEVAKLLTEEWK